MPNWTYNTVEISHSDPAMIERVKKAFLKEKLFSEFFPIPEENSDNWYSWNVENYGTKWDVGGEGAECEEIDENTLQLNFNSAWTPPIEGFRKLTSLGFNIEATYIEEGDSFVGEYTSEDDCDHYDIEQDADWVEENIPEHLNERYDISARMRDNEEWCDEDDIEDENT